MKKSFSYLRIMFCFSFLAIWTVWLINLPKAGNQRLEIRVQSSEKKYPDKTTKITEQKSMVREQLGVKDQKPETKKTNYKEQKQDIKSKKQFSTLPPKANPPLASSSQSSAPKNELPKLANLTPIKEKEAEKQQSKEIDLSFPAIAQATRNALLINKVARTTQTSSTLTPHEREVPLRKEVHLLQNSNNIPHETTTEDKWLPKYLKASKELAPKIENAATNLDKIANQLELVGLINNPDGKGAAIIRNKGNNKIEILKRGEEYEELKLLEINSNEIVLGNQDLNKKYIKKIVFSK